MGWKGRSKVVVKWEKPNFNLITQGCALCILNKYYLMPLIEHTYYLSDLFYGCVGDTDYLGTKPTPRNFLQKEVEIMMWPL